MSFIEKVRTGRLFKRKDVPEVIVKFTFMENTYVLEDFDLSFEQELNHKGQPGGLPKGGVMNLTLIETPDYYLNEWILRDDLLRDGVVRFFTNKQRVDEGASLTISFKDAYCIRYQKKIRTLEDGMFTTITVSPRYIKIGNEEFENRWKEPETLSHYIRSN